MIQIRSALPVRERRESRILALSERHAMANVILSSFNFVSVTGILTVTYLRQATSCKLHPRAGSVPRLEECKLRKADSESSVRALNASGWAGVVLSSGDSP